MSKTILGKVSVTPKQVYNSITAYERLDIVTHDGSSYMCLKDCTGIDVSNTEYWQLLAEKGDKGEQGIPGQNGKDGEKGEKGEPGQNGKDGADGRDGINGTNGIDGHTPQKGVDYFTEQEKTEFKNTVVADSKTDIDTHTANKITEFDNNATTKLEEYNNNSTEKLAEFNNNSAEKTAEFNDNAEELTNRVKELETEVEELSQQAPWAATEIAESIHIEDSAKYSRNKLDLFGNLEQETRKGRNLLALSEHTETFHGVTITTKEDGTVTLNGTATASVNERSWSLKKVNKYKTNTEYVFSAFYVSGNVSSEEDESYRYVFSLRSSATESGSESQFTNNLTFDSATSNNTYTKTVRIHKISSENEGFITKLQVMFSQGRVFDNLTYKL